MSVSDAKHYRFSAEFQAHHVATPLRSILARVLWFDAKGKQVAQAEFPATLPDANEGWSTVTAIYQPPAGATQA
ncbi:MAG: hypothetical protein HY000_00640, partial [Planctomycetes bacterium]|nr:hypothetical protein [Planctomycetota bacterium]